MGLLFNNSKFSFIMTKKRLSYMTYLMKTFKWLIANGIIGLAPLLIIFTVNVIPLVGIDMGTYRYKAS